MSKLDDIIAIFQSVDPPLRLELLLDYANRLPPLPEQYRAQRDAGFNRIPECMTPVFLWVEVNGAVTLHADVAEESPTVKGFVSSSRRGPERRFGRGSGRNPRRSGRSSGFGRRPAHDALHGLKRHRRPAQAHRGRARAPIGSSAGGPMIQDAHHDG